MLSRSSRSRNFFRKLIVNGVSNSKAAIQNDCLMRLYDADAELKAISSELDSFDGKKDPIRCNLLVNQLRTAQDKVISLLFQLMDDCNCERASRDYRMKFPDEILLSEGSESLNGQIWFGAECLSAGSNILNHTKESSMLRPMAKTLTTHLDSLRNDLRDLVVDGGGASRINQALIKKMVTFDHIFATFEYEYVRTMLPIRTVAEIEKLQEVAVLFSETLIDCVKRGLIKQEDIEEFQPIVMIAIPRLAIVRGLLYKNENPIYTRHKSQMSSLFQPFHSPLNLIRRLLRRLSPQELFCLEKMLANDQSAIDSPLTTEKDNPTQSLPIEPSESSTENEGSSCQDANEGGAGTSNSFAHVLMDGLQYPVGKRGIQCANSDQHNQEEQNSMNYIQAPSSSSKSVVPSSASIGSPVESTPSASSSLSSSLDCKTYAGKFEKDDCDKNCCRSPSESDSQLDKLIEEFGPSISHQGESASDMHDATCSSSAMVFSESTDAPEKIPAKTKKVSEDEAQLEELFMRKTQLLLHRLFVAISGVADQLQSNFASDLRFILRHIFNLEEKNDEDNTFDEEADKEYSNSEQSDSSLPIEQGIEAQEVANLIDLGSIDSLDNNYDDFDQNQDVFVPPSSSNCSLITGARDHARHSPTSSLYASITLQSNDPDTGSVRRSRDPMINTVDDDILAEMMRAASQTELIYESRPSPNEASIMDSSRHRQQLVQQHLQSLSRGNRSSSRSHNSTGQHGVERRSRHHGNGGSRSRRARGPPVWVPDQLVLACSSCNVTFTLFRRRHHCRACGQIFCAECSKFTKNLNCWGYNGAVRVCESCFNQP